MKLSWLTETFYEILQAYFLWFRPVLVQAEPHIDGKAYPCAGYFSDKTWLVVSEGGGGGP